MPDNTFSEAAASPEANNSAIINLDHGDPLIYESYWEERGDESHSFSVPLHQSLSYFSENRGGICWFMEPELESQIRKLHHVVGNAAVEGKHIVVGTGSSQLILAALHALSVSIDASDPVSVVAAAPYYSSYPEMAGFLRSSLFEWGGDAVEFEGNGGPYIEIVTSPNNPDGATREAAAVANEGGKRGGGMIVHDLAYYWPQYTAITAALDHDIMLFAASKCSGHAGSRIGWAVVRDEETARKMVKFIEISTIGVSKEAQLRAADILQIISLTCSHDNNDDDDAAFFQRHHSLMAQRWKKLRQILLKDSNLFHITKFPIRYCNFKRESSETYPAFAWMKCKEGVDSEKLMKDHRILTRGGRKFGSKEEYVRVSMVSSDEDFHLFIHRLSTILEKMAEKPEEEEEEEEEEDV